MSPTNHRWDKAKEREQDTPLEHEHAKANRAWLQRRMRRKGTMLRKMAKALQAEAQELLDPEYRRTAAPGEYAERMNGVVRGAAALVDLSIHAAEFITHTEDPNHEHPMPECARCGCPQFAHIPAGLLGPGRCLGEHTSLDCRCKEFKSAG